jgi:hypothetical protein
MGGEAQLNPQPGTASAAPQTPPPTPPMPPTHRGARRWPSVELMSSSEALSFISGLSGFKYLPN